MSGFGVIVFSFYLFDLFPNLLLITSFCLVTFSVYSLNTVTDFEEDAINKPNYKKFENRKKIIVCISILSYISALIIGAIVTLKSIAVLLIPFLAGIFYSVRIKGFRLKNIFIGKNLTVSTTWALESSLLPYVVKASEIVIFLCLFIFIKGMINTILFDMRDVKGDAKAGIKTIPVKLGRKRTFILLLILNTLLIPLIFIDKNILQNYAILMYLIVIYGYIYITYFYLKPNHKLLYSIIVDDEWVLWMLLISSVE